MSSNLRFAPYAGAFLLALISGYALAGPVVTVQEECQTALKQSSPADAQRVCRQALTRAKTVGVRADVLSALGQAYFSGGLSQEAEETLDEAADYYRKQGTLGAEKWVAVQAVRARIAEANNIPRAQLLYQQTLAYAERNPGSRGLSVIKALDAYASFEARNNKLDDASRMYVRAIKDAEKSLGAAHPETLDVRLNYALALLDAERTDEADQMFSGIYQTLEDKNQIETAFTAELLSLMAGVDTQKGRIQEALNKHRKALIIREKVFGKADVRTSQSWNNIGVVYFKLGALGEAEQALSKAYIIRKELLGEQDPLTISARDNLKAVIDTQEAMKTRR